MNAEEYLKQYEDEMRRKHNLRAEYKEEGLMLDNIKKLARYYGKESPEDAAQILELETNRAKLLIYEKEARKNAQKVRRSIAVIPDNEGVVLRKRYIECKKWDTIATEMHYSLTGVHKIHCKALELVDNELSKCQKEG